VEQKKAITDVIDRYRFAQLKQICFILTIFPIAPEKKNELIKLIQMEQNL